MPQMLSIYHICTSLLPRLILIHRVVKLACSNLVRFQYALLFYLCYLPGFSHPILVSDSYKITV